MISWLNKKAEESPYKLAMYGGAIVAFLASAIMAGVSELFPSFNSGSLEEIGQWFSGSPVVVSILLFLIIIVSPLIEELIFRKFLWWLSSKLFSPYTTLFVISILFVAIHGEVVHAVGLLPISFFLGWLRMKTGSVKHCTVAHMANNAAASVFFFL